MNNCVIQAKVTSIYVSLFSAFTCKHASVLRAQVYHVGPTPSGENSKMMKAQLSSPERLGQTDTKKQILDLASV